MKLTAIHLENFKAICKRTKIPIRPITLLFGPNSAGKSTIIHALHYLYEVLEHRNSDVGRPELAKTALDFGGFINTVHGRDPYSQMAFRLDFDLEQDEFSEASERFARHDLFDAPFLSNEPIQSMSLEIVIGTNDLHGPFVARYEVSLNSKRLGTIDSNGDRKNVALNQLEFDHPQLEWASFEGESHPFDFSQCPDRASNSFGVAKLKDAMPYLRESLELKPPFWWDSTGNTTDVFLDLFSRLFLTPAVLIRNYLRKMRYVGPLRELPPRNFKPRRRMDQGRWENGLGAWDTMYCKGRPLVNKVSSWIGDEDKINSGYNVKWKEYKELDTEHRLFTNIEEGEDLSPYEIRDMLNEIPTQTRLSIVDKSSGRELHSHDLGVGISQVLPIVVAAVDQTAGVVGIEQPELHVHPGLQVSLGDLFIEHICEGRSFIIETHSEHLLLRILRRIREKTEKTLPVHLSGLLPLDLSVIFIDHGPKGFKSIPIPVDSFGEFKGRWPRGFFEERIEEVL